MVIMGGIGLPRDDVEGFAGERLLPDAVQPQT